MKILIITTYYPPDTAIAAVRPYMFAKYLAKYGHEVTVLRSGEIRDGFSNYFREIPDVRVISYLGYGADAERFARGEISALDPSRGRSRLNFLPGLLRKPLGILYHRLAHGPRHIHAHQQILNKVKLLNKALDDLRSERFDIVFSTYGQLENIYGGQYAAKLFSCPLIQDFRDALAVRAFQRKKEYDFWKKIQNEAVEKADSCTAVSKGVLQDVCHGLSAKDAIVLYNGYEPTAAVNCESTPLPGELSFCYTGQLYAGLRDFSPLLKAICHLNTTGKISLNKIRIHYAGKDYDYLYQQAEKYHITEILVDHGYVGREETARMQAEADVFTVLSWNTASEQGILTGKFYEGIRAGKPILSIVSGDIPHSELKLLNDTYHYGFCYESCREEEQFQQLCDYLEGLYREKTATGVISYNPDSALETDFRYDILAKKLEQLCLHLTQPGE